MIKSSYAYILAVIAVFSWSFNFLIASYLGDKLQPFQIAFGRWIIAAIILLPLTIKSILEYKSILLQHWKKIVAMALIAVVIQNTIIFQAGRTASVINMSLIGTTGPLFLVLFSAIYLKNKITLKQIVGFFIAFLGVLTIITKGDFFDLDKMTLVAGDFWMLLMTLSFGIYGVMQAKKIPKVPEITILGAMVLIGISVLIPIFLVTLITHPIKEITWGIVGVEIYMGIFPSIVSFLCWNVSLARIGPLKTGLIYYLMPVFCSIEAYFIFDERMSLAQLFGGILVIAGVFVTAYHKQTKVLEIQKV